NTPTTRNRTPAIVTCAPTGSRSPNSASATREPSTATRRAVSTSERVRQEPRDRSRTNTWVVVSSTPSTLVNRLAVPARTISPDPTCTATRSRSPTTLTTASTSAMDNRDRVGAAATVVSPGKTSSRLEPSPSTRRSTSYLAPVPIPTSTTTAATPMRTPSTVSPLRSRLARSASAATRHASASLIAAPPARPPRPARPSHHLSVAHLDDSMGSGGHLPVVGDEHHRHPGLGAARLQQLQHRPPGDGVEV